MFRKLLMVIGVCLVVFLAGCKGDDGAVGPAGPAGPAGQQGPAGPAGTNATGGSSAIILQTQAVTGAGTNNDLAFALLDSLTAEEEEFYDTGVAVLVYAKSLGVWWPLPGNVQFANNNVGSFTFVHGVDSGTFFVDIFTTGNSEGQTTPPVRSFDDIRIVLLPDSGGARLSADVNLNSYEETIKALGLTDLSAKRASFFRRK